MRFSLILILLLSTITTYGQNICSGNLGDNIFTRGDFGVGTDPILNIDPMIAPGYTYIQSVPNDGQYTITNNTGALPGLYPTWLAVEDSSDDPNGYMMVVNASFSPGIFYEEVVDGLCENTLYEFSADIINLIRQGTPNHIDPNLDFLIDNQVVYSTGIIPKTQRWEKYGFTFVTTATQSSIKLTLRNNAPGGAGNDLALDNISFRPCGPASFIGIEGGETIFLCKNDDPVRIFAEIDGSTGEDFSVQWQESANGINWDDIPDSNGVFITHTEFDPGVYYYRYYSAGNEINLLNEKCRVISDIIQVEVLPEVFQLRDTICEGLEYVLGNQNLSTSGMYEESFTSSFGCDSIVELDLVVVPSLPIGGIVNVTNPACFGEMNGSIVVDSLFGGYGEVAFIITGQNNISDGNLSSGLYSITYSDRFGCMDFELVSLVDPPEIVIEIGNDTTVKLGDDIAVFPSYSEEDLTVDWNGDGIFDCVDCETTTFLPYINTLLVLTAENQNGCTVADSLFVTVDGEGLLHLPNVFSPNDDFINDGFTIEFYGRSVAVISVFRVYDRWGGLMHELVDFPIQSGDVLWDGYVNEGTMVSQGIYGFELTVQYINEQRQTILGDVTVIR